MFKIHMLFQNCFLLLTIPDTFGSNKRTAVYNNAYHFRIHSFPSDCTKFKKISRFSSTGILYAYTLHSVSNMLFVSHYYGFE